MCRHSGAFQALGELLGGLVFILVEDDVKETAWPVGKLLPLGGSEMGADSASGVAKAGLPQHRQIEESFHQDHGGEAADGLPGKQAALRVRQQSMGESGANATAIERVKKVPEQKAELLFRDAV